MIIRRLAAPLLAAGLLIGCAGGGDHDDGDGHGGHETSAADVKTVPASKVIDMQKGGSPEPELLEWVNDASRTFDLTDSDVADLMEGGVPDAVVNAMMARSDEHHAAEGGSSGDGHSHSHEH
ncbi:MAG: hypothetical protein JKY65_10100 [Planctomycetes bacterium]|nr:hypothetical protein [Planctomycetota bacterium]